MTGITISHDARTLHHVLSEDILSFINPIAHFACIVTEPLPLDTRTYARRMSLASALIPVLERLVQTDTVELDAWGVGITLSVGEAAQTALHEIAARTTGQRPTPDSAEPPADGEA